MTYEDRLLGEIVEQHGHRVPPRWQPRVPYERGQVVVMEVAVRRNLLQRLLRRPVRYVTKRWRAK